MKNKINEILEKLNNGKINAKEALKLIKEVKWEYTDDEVKASKLKIVVIDKKEGNSINIPALPFWMIRGLGSIALKFTSFGVKHSNNIDDNAKKHIDKIKELDLDEIFNVLKNYGPCDIVHITKKDKSEIKITTL